MRCSPLVGLNKIPLIARRGIQRDYHNPRILSSIPTPDHAHLGFGHVILASKRAAKGLMLTVELFRVDALLLVVVC
jgi:hypothetical protein